MSRVILVIAFAAGLATGAAAQPLVPLSDYMALPQERRAASYPALRCAGLHFGIIDYAGATLPPDTLRQSQDAATTLVLLAAAIRLREQGGEAEPHISSAMATVVRIAAMYKSRIEANFAATGAAWQNDDLIRSDFLICQQVLTAFR